MTALQPVLPKNLDNINYGTAARAVAELPQKYKNQIKSENRKNENSVKRGLSEKVGKADKLLTEIAKEAENAPLADEKRQKIAANIKTTQKTLSDLADVYPKDLIQNPFNQWLEKTEEELSLWECLDERPEGENLKC